MVILMDERAVQHKKPYGKSSEWEKTHMVLVWQDACRGEAPSR